MATTNADGVFLDTNVLVYAVVEDGPLYAAASRAIKECSTRPSGCWISRQVLREFIATLTRPQPFAPPFPSSTVVRQARHFEASFRLAEDGPAVTQRLLELVEQFPLGGKRVHDANIVATMLAHGIPRLLTHNTRDFLPFSNLIGIEPLEAYAGNTAR
jgi:predicted nucleic acid-binding protein